MLLEIDKKEFQYKKAYKFANTARIKNKSYNELVDNWNNNNPKLAISENIKEKFNKYYKAIENVSVIKSKL